MAARRVRRRARVSRCSCGRLAVDPRRHRLSARARCRRATHCRTPILSRPRSRRRARRRLLPRARPLRPGERRAMRCAYHLARAAFWKQEHQLGYIANAVEPQARRQSAERGDRAAGHDGTSRAAIAIVALPQFAAYAALVLCVAVLARRIGLGLPGGALRRPRLRDAPCGARAGVELAQRSRGRVVPLAIAAVFALRPGRASLVLVALAIGLAVGTKFTAPSSRCPAWRSSRPSPGPAGLGCADRRRAGRGLRSDPRGT